MEEVETVWILSPPWIRTIESQYEFLESVMPSPSELDLSPRATERVEVEVSSKDYLYRWDLWDSEASCHVWLKALNMTDGTPTGDVLAEAGLRVEAS